MQIQHFPQTRTFTLRPSYKAMKNVAKADLPYKLQVVGLAYGQTANSEMDDEWYMINENPHILYSRRFVEQNYELCERNLHISEKSSNFAAQNRME